MLAMVLEVIVIGVRNGVYCVLKYLKVLKC